MYFSVSYLYTLSFPVEDLSRNLEHISKVKEKQGKKKSTEEWCHDEIITKTEPFAQENENKISFNVAIQLDMFLTKRYRTKTKGKTGYNFAKHLFHKNKITTFWLWKSTPSID